MWKSSFDRIYANYAFRKLEPSQPDRCLRREAPAALNPTSVCPQMHTSSAPATTGIFGCRWQHKSYLGAAGVFIVLSEINAATCQFLQFRPFCILAHCVFLLFLYPQSLQTTNLSLSSGTAERCISLRLYFEISASGSEIEDVSVDIGRKWHLEENVRDPFRKPDTYSDWCNDDVESGRKRRDVGHLLTLNFSPLPFRYYGESFEYSKQANQTTWEYQHCSGQNVT